MIYLFTGAPGTYKTYSAIAFARELAGDKRPVYVHGVTDIKVPGWTVIDRDDVTKWRDTLPEGAVLLCDEVSDQRYRNCHYVTAACTPPIAILTARNDAHARIRTEIYPAKSHSISSGNE